MIPGDEHQLLRISGLCDEFLQRIERFPTPVGIKAALAVRGIQTGPLATPLGPETRSALDEFGEWSRVWLLAL